MPATLHKGREVTKLVYKCEGYSPRVELTIALGVIGVFTYEIFMEKTSEEPS